MCGHPAYEGTFFSPHQSLGLTSQPDAGPLPFYRTRAHTKLHDRFCARACSPLSHHRGMQGGKTNNEGTEGRDHQAPAGAASSAPRTSRGGWGWWGRRGPLRDGGLGEQSAGVSEEGQGVVGKRRHGMCAGRRRNGSGPRQSWERLCGSCGKSQPEARIPCNKHLQHLLSARKRARLGHWARPCPGTTAWLTEGPQGPLEQMRGLERVQEPGLGLRITWLWAVPQPWGDLNSVASWGPTHGKELPSHRPPGILPRLRQGEPGGQRELNWLP